MGGEVRELGEHREDVVRRLLAHGVSASTLRALLPGWAPLIAAVVAERAGVDEAPPRAGRPESAA